jgi:LuxR family maltose regulon positive regulatory protein
MLASRVDPPLSLARLRVRGQMLELRDADLRFQKTEVASFLTDAMKLSLSEAEMSVLEQRTEGWIAGLLLAALALQQREDRSAFVWSFTGSQRYLLDYVQEEMLACLPAAMQRFLFYTAILNRMSASLCQAVTEEADSQALLERLERANLFLVPLDEERRWYRLHALIREALLAHLQATQPTLVVRLHRRAAHWYEEQGELREAIAHLLSAEDFSAAASLMEHAAEEVWLQGETQTLYRWVMALPDAVVREHACLLLNAALYLLNANSLTIEAQRIRAQTQAEQMMARVEAAMMAGAHEALQQRVNGDAAWSTTTGSSLSADHTLTAAETALLQRRLRLLRVWIASFEAMATSDREQLRLMYQQIRHLDNEDEVTWQVIPLSIAFTFRETFLREGAFLLPLFVQARQRVQQTHDRFATFKITQWLPHLYMRAGQLR